MASGVILPSLISLATSTSETIIIGSQTAAKKIAADAISKAPLSTDSIVQLKQSVNNAVAPINTMWVPPQWSKTALTIISVVYPPFTVSSEQPIPVQLNYVFDAVFKLTHRRILKKTTHPVLTGANITDHAYIEPARVTLEIGMSDAMAAYTDGMWSTQATKSVSAWSKIKEWQNNKMLLTLTTRLDTYARMMIIEAEAPDDNQTRHGLKANVIFEELLSASVTSIAPASGRPNATDATNAGVIQATNPRQSDLDQHNIPDFLKQYGFPGLPPGATFPDVPLPDPLTSYPIELYPQVPGAGSIGGNTLYPYARGIMF